MRKLISQRQKLFELYFGVRARAPAFRNAIINTVRYDITYNQQPIVKP